MMIKYQERQTILDMNNVDKVQLLHIKQLYDLYYRNEDQDPVMILIIKCIQTFIQKKIHIFMLIEHKFFQID